VSGYSESGSSRYLQSHARLPAAGAGPAPAFAFSGVFTVDGPLPSPWVVEAGTWDVDHTLNAPSGAAIDIGTNGDTAIATVDMGNTTPGSVAAQIYMPAVTPGAGVSGCVALFSDTDNYLAAWYDYSDSSVHAIQVVGGVQTDLGNDVVPVPLQTDTPLLIITYSGDGTAAEYFYLPTSTTMYSGPYDSRVAGTRGGIITTASDPDPANCSGATTFGATNDGGVESGGTAFADNFHRPDSLDLGAPWVVGTGHVGVESDQAANTGGGAANTTHLDAQATFGATKGTYSFTVPTGWDPSLGPSVSVIMVCLDDGSHNNGITVELNNSAPPTCQVVCSNETGTLFEAVDQPFTVGTTYSILVDDASPNNIHYLADGVEQFAWHSDLTGTVCALATFNSPADYPLTSLFTFAPGPAPAGGGSHDYGSHPL
jgi:hypothetical protein